MWRHRRSDSARSLADQIRTAACDSGHCTGAYRGRCLLLSPRSGTLMRVSRVGALTMTLIAVLWAVTPAVACLLPAHQMTPAEHECCHKMAQQCGSLAMPSSHSCCQVHQRESAVSPVTTYSPTRLFSLAIIHQTSFILISSTSISPRSRALEAPPPESSRGCSSVLRI
jgi:hypothetical protein